MLVITQSSSNNLERKTKTNQPKIRPSCLLLMRTTDYEQTCFTLPPWRSIHGRKWLTASPSAILEYWPCAQRPRALKDGAWYPVFHGLRSAPEKGEGKEVGRAPALISKVLLALQLIEVYWEPFSSRCSAPERRLRQYPTKLVKLLSHTPQSFSAFSWPTSGEIGENWNFTVCYRRTNEPIQF